jgi:hypothetical protein
MSGFRRSRDGSIRVSIGTYEAAVLRNLCDQMTEMLGTEEMDADELGAAKAQEDEVDAEHGSAETTAPGSGSPSQLAAMLGPGFGSDVAPDRPSDPVIARLLPDAYDDEEQAGEFRRFTEYDLRRRKLGHVRVFIDKIGDGGSLVLTREDAQAWLGALNDLRLALGTRLDVSEDEEDIPDEDDPRQPMFEVYRWLTYLQDSLISAMVG